MKQAPRLVLAAVLALAAAVAIGCQNGVSGPSLTAVTSQLSLVPTLGSTPDLSANMNTCCCHVSGTVKNTSSIEVNVELRFPAKNRQTGESVGMGLALQKNMAAGASRSFEAVGIYAPCNSIDLTQIDRDKMVNIKGLWQPE